MVTIYREQDAKVELLKGKTIAILGYGSQGHAHANNLKESGMSVIVGLRAGGNSWGKAKAAKFQVLDVPSAVKKADIVMVLLPDELQGGIYNSEVAPNLKQGASLMFAHGFSIHFGQIVPRADVNVFMVAPKGPGHLVRSQYLKGEGVPALIAVHQDPSGKSRDLALAYAAGIGATRAGVIETSFREETETDLFGEQAVLCGGVSHLVKAGFQTLVDAGYQPEVAYFECMHELKLIVDLMYRGGLNYMRYSISDTAEYGDYVAGPRLINADVKAEMGKLLAEIKDGSFATRWIRENQTGRASFAATRAAERDQPLEHVGRGLRAMMTFVNPVEIDFD